MPSAQARESGGVLALLDSVVFYGLIVLIVLTAIPYGTVAPWSRAIFECAVFFLTLLWIIQGFLAGSWGVVNTRLIIPMAALVVLAIVQSLVWSQADWAGSKVGNSLSADPFETWIFVIRATALILAAVLLIRFTSSRRRLGILVHAIIGVAIVSALFGISRQAVQSMQLQHAPGFFLPRLRPSIGYAQFINKNHFSFLIEMAMGLVIGVGFMRGRRQERIPVYLAALLAMWAALVLSVSRGALMAMSAQVVFAVLLFVNSRRPGKSRGVDAAPGRFAWTRSLPVKIVMAGALVAIVVAGIVWLSGDQLAARGESAAAEMGGVDPTELHEGARRRDIWRASWLMFKAHPIAGAGLGGYWAEVPRYHGASGVTTPQQAHNDYLELLASAGIVGGGLLGWFAISLIKQARKNFRSSEGFQRAASLGAMVGLAGVGVHSIVDFGLHITINGLVFAALLAIISLAPIPHTKRYRPKTS